MEHERVVGAPVPARARLLAWGAAAVPLGAVVGAYGELTPEALVVVLVTGAVVVAVGVWRRAGEGAASVGSGMPWLALLVAVSLWELFTYAGNGRLPTLSDLMDDVLAYPLPRAAAAVAWLLLGSWLLTRPRAGADVGGVPR